MTLYCCARSGLSVASSPEGRQPPTVQNTTTISQPTQAPTPPLPVSFPASTAAIQQGRPQTAQVTPTPASPLLSRFSQPQPQQYPQNAASSSATNAFAAQQAQNIAASIAAAQHRPMTAPHPQMMMQTAASSASQMRAASPAMGSRNFQNFAQYTIHGAAATPGTMSTRSSFNSKSGIMPDDDPGPAMSANGSPRSSYAGSVVSGATGRCRVW